MLVSLLKIIGGINSCGIVLNSTQLLKISIGVKKSLGNIVAKDTKGILLLRPKLLKSLKPAIELSKDRNTYFNTTATL